MTDALTMEEAGNVATAILPTVNEWVTKSMFERAHLRISDIANIIPSVKRAGSTPDTYCKIATAMFKRGIATDLRKDRKSNMLLSFRVVKPEDNPPSLEICSARWEMIKILGFENVRSLEFEENEIDNLSQKDAEKILIELK